jgi:hypothetical protein
VTGFAVGDVRRVEVNGLERLVVVLKDAATYGGVQVTLVHPYVEYATEGDLIVDGGVIGKSYSLVVHAGWRFVVPAVAVDEKLVASLPDEVVARCLRPSGSVALPAGVWAGCHRCGSFPSAILEFKAAEWRDVGRLQAWE